jgi:hypothetical protein
MTVLPNPTCRPLAVVTFRPTPSIPLQCIFSQAAGVNAINCPVSYQKELVVTQTIDFLTTVCPSCTAITTPPIKSSMDTITPMASYLSPELLTLTPCGTPVVDTFVTSPMSVLGQVIVIPTIEEAIIATRVTAHSTLDIANSSTSLGVKRPSASSSNTTFSGSPNMPPTQSPVAVAAGFRTKPLSFAALYSPGVLWSFCFILEHNSIGHKSRGTWWAT